METGVEFVAADMPQANRLTIHILAAFAEPSRLRIDAEWGKSYVDMQVAPRGQFWLDPSRAHQDNLWESWVELGEDFFAAITAAPVPVDMRALRGLKRSPLALDLYALLTHTAFAASRKGISRSIPWEGLHTQMGAEYALLRQFRAKVVAALRRIQTALKVETTEDALVVHPSRPAIAKRPDFPQTATVKR